MNESDEIPHVNGRNLLMRVPSSPSTPYSSSMPILSKLNGLSILQAESAAVRRRRGRMQPVYEESEDAKTETPIRCLECNIYTPCVALCYCMSCVLRIKMCSGCGQSETHTHHINRTNRGPVSSSFMYVCIRCAQNMVFNHSVSSSP